MGSLKIVLASLATTLALSGCMSAPHKAYTVEQPQTAPARNLTNMDLALSCLDRQLQDYNAPHKRLTSTGILSRAGDKVGMTSGVDMFKTSIGQLSLSNAYTYVDLASLAMANFGTNGGEMTNRPLDPQSISNWFVFLRQNAGSGKIHFEFPDYNITGAISQADNNVTSDQVSGGLDAGGNGNAQGGLGGSMNQGVTVVTVDMHVQDSTSLQMVNGLTTKNSIAVVRSSVGADLSGRVSALGGHFNVSLDRTEGMHQAIRILIQLGTVELLGRLAHVPYEQCLTGETVQANALGKAHEGFEAMAEDERVRFAQQKLAALVDPKSFDHAVYYHGPANGVADAATREAIGRYQKDAGLIANGQVDLDLYRSLQHREAEAAAAPAQPAAPSLSLQPGPGTTFKLGSKLAVNLTTSADAHVQCFLQDEQKKVFRIFPSTDQADDFLAAGQTLTVPSPAATRQIVLNTAERHEFGCVVSADALKAGQALPIAPPGDTTLPVSSLQEVAEQYRRAAGAAAVGFESLSVRAR